MSRAGSTIMVRRAARRLGLQAALLGAVVVVLLSAAAVVVVVQGQHRSAVDELHVAAIRADDIDDPPAWTALAIQGPSGDRRAGVDPSLPKGLPDRAAMDRVAAGGPAELFEVHLGGVDYLVETLRQPTGLTVQAVLDLTPNHTARDQLIDALLISGIAGLVLIALVGTWLGGRALGPLSTTLEIQRRFVADASHELRTPVTLLHTRAQLLRRRMRRDGPDTAPDDLDALVADSARLADILDELLLAADPGIEQAPVPIELTALARDVVESAAAFAAQRQVALVAPASDDAPVAVSGWPVALRRAVTALVDNAVRHAHGRVAVEVSATGHTARIDVIDDGPGMDPELVPRMFDRFAVGGGSTSGRRRYGIGLSLVNEIAAAHGGRVELLDRDTPGSALRIALPARGVGTPASPRSGQAAAGPRRGRS
ncbi:sensor histidine kinase [Pseudonocardia sp. CA-107938]|uniref:sensor histidine kinase n=1 Tax=Pseudonocardia sp. CA-107938 TaxID=3240021 RepID=UPI003D8F067B